MTQQRLCLACTTPFEVPAASKRQYCSPGCWPRQTHSRKGRAYVTVTCAHCGTEFDREAYMVERRAKQGWANYCSRTCRDAVKRGRKGSERVERVQLKCEYCERAFELPPNETKDRKYCSRSCAQRATKGRPPRSEHRFVNGDGYVFVFVPKDERPPGQEQTARHPEHRLVMARTLGRSLSSRESVHHINGDRADNRPENLQLRNGSHGHGQVLRCRCCGSSDIEAIELA